MNKINVDEQAIAPSKVVCIGRNYVEHIEELNNEVPTELVIFIKPNSSISSELVFCGHDAIHYEGEISLLINDGKIAAVGFGLDLTKREIQGRLKGKGLPWERSKAFDKAAVFSDFVGFDGNVTSLRMELSINGALIQHAHYDLMLHKPDDILKEISTFLTLEDGDIVMTGTPKGVGVISVGDEFVGKIFQGDDLLVKKSWIVKS